MYDEDENIQQNLNEIDSGSWWTIGSRGTVLGCGKLSGTWLPNKALLYDITFLQFQSEAGKNNTQAFNFSNLVDKKITTYIDEINLRRHILNSSTERMKKLLKKDSLNRKKHKK